MFFYFSYLIHKIITKDEYNIDELKNSIKIYSLT